VSQIHQNTACSPGSKDKPVIFQLVALPTLPFPTLPAAKYLVSGFNRWVHLVDLVHRDSRGITTSHHWRRKCGIKPAQRTLPDQDTNKTIIIIIIYRPHRKVLRDPLCGGDRLSANRRSSKPDEEYSIYSVRDICLRNEEGIHPSTSGACRQS
jgi:hypothetical protein